MGVPKFFRYISERYPNLSELVGIKEMPQFDNMYLDMNGIVHNCSHPDDSNVHFRITEEQIFRDIFHYLDTLFRLIQPTSLFFMAIDGVAPRAKMNQQRGRRFRSAKEAQDLIDKAKEKGETLPEESRFDSNCITPGTEFMVRLQEALKHFIKSKISNDISWQNCTIILSGHETPGEGEHKIMEYIRYLKADPSYKSNTRHCLYGLDADLIMLGLCTHEHQFSLLREEVKFDKKAKRATSVDDTKFFLLHLGLLREYLELEFIAVKDELSFDYDIERVIDDWVFMCFLVGNDFIPHLPNLHINSNALPILYKTYREVLPMMDGYINEGGKLNLARLEIFMAKLGTVDRDLFREHYSDIKGMDTDLNNAVTFDVDVNEIVSAETQADLSELIKKSNLDFGVSSDEDSDDEDKSSGNLSMDDMIDENCSEDELFEREFLVHKRHYYINKMKYPEMTEEVLADQTEIYITALQWTLSYYYRGVCSWGWYYPHHYAPYISDIQNFKHLNINLDLGKPFLPFQQLLAVLPSASKELLPNAYHALMTQANSKLIDYYPVEFLTDLNGKKQEWEAVVLIPFIDETKLLDAMKDCASLLTDTERDRNIHGPMLKYNFTERDLGVVAETRLGQTAICHNHCKEVQIWRAEVDVPEDKLVLGPSKGVKKNAYYPGFPTMRHLKYTASLVSCQIKVFEQPSRNESQVITIENNEPSVDLQTLAKRFMGKEVFVGWPHLREAKVVAVSDCDGKFDTSGYTKYEDKSREFSLLKKHMLDHHSNRMGINLGEVEQLVHVTPMLSREYVVNSQGGAKMFLMKKWSATEVVCAPHAIVRNLGVQYEELDPYKTVEQVYANGSIIFMMNEMYYGSQGVVVEPLLSNGRLKIQLLAHPQPDFREAKRVLREDNLAYMNSYHASSQIGINPRVFARITGTVLIVQGQKRFPLPDRASKSNIGLQLRFPKTSEEVMDYTRCDERQWMFSQKTVDLVQEYMLKFPKVFELMNQHRAQSDFLFESELEDGGGEDGNTEEDTAKPLVKITRWMKEQPHNKALRRSVGSASLNRPAIQCIVDAVEKNKQQPVKSIKLQVKPHLLYKPNLNSISVRPDAKATFELFDRVVIGRQGYSVPLGARGTVIGIEPLIDVNPVRQENINAVEYFYVILFDESIEYGSSIFGIAEKKVFKVRQSVLINISYGTGTNREKAAQFPTYNSNNRTNRIGNRNQVPQVQILRKDNDNLGNQQSYSQVLSAAKVQNRPQSGKDARANGPNQVKTGDRRQNDNQNAVQHSNMNGRNKNDAKQATDHRQNQIPTYPAVQSNVGPAPLPTVDSSDALRKLLRISADTEPITAPQTIPIDLNAIFSKSATIGDGMLELPKSLPKPPANWHMKKPIDSEDTGLVSQPIETQAHDDQQQSSAIAQPLPPQMAAFVPHPMAVPPSHLPNGQVPFMAGAPLFIHHPGMPPPHMIPIMHPNGPPAYVHPPMQRHPMPMSSHHPNIPPFVQHGGGNLYQRPPQHMPPPFGGHPGMVAAPYQEPPASQPKSTAAANQQRPNGPHNLSNNSKYAPGNGAFIPLQAARKNVKPKVTTANQQSAAPKEKKIVEPNPASAGVTQKTDSVAAQPIEPVPEPQPKPPAPVKTAKARPMRLAANFKPPA